jgi:hypothetical protein
VEQPLRVAEFDELFHTAVQRSARPRQTGLEVVITPESELRARDLAERETGCCSFFRFEFHHADDGVLMRIDVPETHVDVLDALEARVSTIVGVKTGDEHV